MQHEQDHRELRNVFGSAGDEGMRATDKKPEKGQQNSRSPTRQLVWKPYCIIRNHSPRSNRPQKQRQVTQRRVVGRKRYP